MGLKVLFAPYLSVVFLFLIVSTCLLYTAICLDRDLGQLRGEKLNYESTAKEIS